MKAQTGIFFLPALIQLFWTSCLVAQTTPPAADAVHLISGHIHRGIIVEQIPGASIRLWRTTEGDTLAFEMDEIERIAKIVPAAGEQAAQFASPAIEPKTSGVNTSAWATALQFSTGGGDHSIVGMGATVQRRLNNQRSWLGLGLSFVGDENNYGTHSLGLAAHSSHEFSTGLKGRFGVLAFADLGYSFNLGNDYFDEQAQATLRYGNGLHLQTGLRFRINLLRNAGIWLDLSYLRNTSTLRIAANNDKVADKAWNMFCLRGSIFF